MIKSKRELKEYILYEKNMYITTNKHLFHLWIVKDEIYYIWKMMWCLRHLEYHVNNHHFLRSVFWEKRKNYYAMRCGVYINPNTAEIGLRIWHAGSIIIHSDAHLGRDCQLHGCNCIGNKGTIGSGVPHIGDYVNIGVGAVIIGDINIADYTVVAANAVVTKSFSSKPAILAGVPAKEVANK